MSFLRGKLRHFPGGAPVTMLTIIIWFKRLKKTGVMDVVNPVQKAVEEGKFEELD